MTLLLALLLTTQKFHLSNTLQLPRMLKMDGCLFRWVLPKGWATNVRPYERPWPYRLFDGALFHGQTGHRFEVMIWDAKDLSRLPSLKGDPRDFRYRYKDQNLWLVKAPPYLTSAHQGTLFSLFINGVSPKESKTLIQAFGKSKLIPLQMKPHK